MNLAEQLDIAQAAITKVLAHSNELKVEDFHDLVMSRDAILTVRRNLEKV